MLLAVLQVWYDRLQACSRGERLQAELADKAAELATAQEQHATSDADWESRMKDAVSSAEQWKEFAEKLGAEKETLQSTLAATEQTLAVGSFKHHLVPWRGTLLVHLKLTLVDRHSARDTYSDF